MSVYITHKSSIQEVKLRTYNHGNCSSNNNNEPMGLAVDAVYEIEDEQINKIEIKIKSKFRFVIDPFNSTYVTI